MKDLTTSNIHRQNILNNNYAIQQIKQALGIGGILFENKIYFTKKQVATFYEVDEKTIERLLDKYEEELRKNGYEILEGTRLANFKKNATQEPLPEAKNGQLTDINVAQSHTRNLGLFDFRSFLNSGMLLTVSEKAQTVRSIILDITLDTINKKTGGSTKYINQREEEFLLSSFKEDDYHKKFKNALHEYVDMGPAKFAIYTNKIYKSIFKENAQEYRKILKLEAKDQTRDTFYSETINMVSSYESGLTKYIEKKAKSLNRKLNSVELDILFQDFESMSESILAPHLHDNRRKMASRDLCFREVLHKELEEYAGEVSTSDFEKFLGAKSMDLSDRIEESKEIFKRLKDR